MSGRTLSLVLVLAGLLIGENAGATTHKKKSTAKKTKHHAAPTQAAPPLLSEPAPLAPPPVAPPPSAAVPNAKPVPLSERVHAPVQCAAPAPAPAPAPSASPVEDTPRLFLPNTLTLIDVFAGFHGFYRQLSYYDDLYSAFSGFREPFAPALFASLEYYPARHIPEPGLLDYLGFIGWFEYGFAPAAKDKITNATYLSSTFYGAGGGRGRLPLGPTELGVSGMVGEHDYTFRVKGATASNGVVLSTAYTYVRAGLDFRVHIGSHFLVLLEGGYLGITDAGPLSQDFPRSYIGGIDARVGLSWRLAGGLQARLYGGYIRYFDRFNPKPGDSYIVGGALDQYFSGDVGLAYTY